MTKHVASSDGTIDVRNDNFNVEIPEENSALDLLDALDARNHGKCDLIGAISEMQLF